MTLKDVFIHTLRTESAAIDAAAQRLGQSIEPVIQLLASCKGKVVVSGVGKSGLIGRKISATFSSTGTPSVFLHAGEAFHGDLGVCAEGDLALLISHSGTTVELVRLIPILRSFGIKIIAIVGNMESPIAHDADIVIDASVEKESDTMNLVPTSSSTLALAVGDALAIALMENRHFSKDDFARYHPGGQIGKNLLWKVHQVMHPKQRVACVSPNTSVKEVIIQMTRYPLGAACVVNENQHLVGLITDGDIRRILVEWDEISGKTADNLMTRSPIAIAPSNTLIQAIELMEKRESPISVLPVVDQGKVTGLIRIHDVY
ncbi:MAG: KpsF/GutQ family sugar-phosphate isomerase [Flavobacteriales bacterium]|nr:KpsF/GutQ family sugar-phosphate isomerase [Flavobacteriales bacterium]MCZ2443883.1 KpsF/GutQ family sugar-phosphate isomerase [Flavobacteriales bacterium]